MSLVVVVLGAAMIVYTMRGGVAAVIWTDVVQLFVYVAGALIVLASLLGQIDGGCGAVLAAGPATPASFASSTSRWTPRACTRSGRGSSAALR